MPRCDFCGKNVSLPFHCQYCGKNFCDEHRLPPNHACNGLAEWKKTPAPGVGIRYGAGGASAYGGGYAAAPIRKKSGRVPVWKHPYFRIALVAIVLLIVVILFILMVGCIQPGENSTANAGTATETPTETGTPVPVTTPATPVITTISPVTTPTTGPTQVRVRPTVTSGQYTRKITTVTTAITTTASRYTTASTKSPPFTPVPGKLSADPYTISTTSLAARIHELINIHRAAYGLRPLTTDSELAAIALGHSTDMAANNFFSHTNPAGQTPTDRGTAAGYTCRKDYGTYYTYGIAENIFQNNLYESVTYENGAYTYDWTSPEDIAQSTVTGWMNSEGHKKNILTETYNREGIGIAIAADDKVYITEDFC